MKTYIRTCFVCKQQFSRNSRNEASRKNKNIILDFCNKNCHKQYQQSFKIEVSCKNCQTNFYKKKNQILKTKNNFCSKSCAATFNNKNKTFGIRRSKLEIYIEEQLKKDFPSLVFVFNSKEAIKSELDIFIPQLKLAFELNGIFHYEPIYGNSKLDKIQNNDKQKIITCFEQGIELCIIDTSSCKYLNNNNKIKYYKIVKDLVIQNFERAEKTNVQVP